MKKIAALSCMIILLFGGCGSDTYDRETSGKDISYKLSSQNDDSSEYTAASPALLADDSIADKTPSAEETEPIVTDGETEEEETDLPSYHMIEVNNIMQGPELPCGCEIVSLTIVLNYLGYGADKVDMAKNYLDKKYFWFSDGKLFGADPYEAFAGDPADSYSTGCFPPVIKESANKYFKDHGNIHIAKDISGTPAETLLHKYVDNDIPVIIWITSCELHEAVYTFSWYIDDETEYTFPTYEHCVVLTGYDTEKNRIYVSDPLVGNTSYDIDLLKQRFEQLGSCSVVIEEDK